MTTGTTRKRAAILLVHGFNGHLRRTWDPFAMEMMRRVSIADWDLYSFGYRTGLCPDWQRWIWTADPDLTSVAGTLLTELRTPPLRNYDALVVIAHSMGGLVVQRALVDSGPEDRLAERADQVLLLGTPSGGLWMARVARWLLWKTSVRDMAPGSAFLKDLRTRWVSSFHGAPPFSFVVSRGAEDQFVYEESSSSPFPARQRQVIEGKHTTMIDPGVARGCVDVMMQNIIGAAPLAGPLGSAAQAAQRVRFRKVVLDYGPNQDRLDLRATRELGIAYAKLGQVDTAIAYLSRHVDHDTDLLGIVGGCYKRRWQETGTVDAGESALRLYRRGYDQATAVLTTAVGPAGTASEKTSFENLEGHEQAYYHGINIAYLLLEYKVDEAAARDMAQTVLGHCQAARDLEGLLGKSPDPWRLATEGEAYLIRRQVEAAVTAYRAAYGLLRMETWQLQTTYDQALRVARRLRLDRASEILPILFEERVAA